MMNTDENLIDIIIADTQYLITEALKAILTKPYTIQCIVSSQYELRKVLQSNFRGILILDYALMDFNSFDEIKEIRKSFPQVSILLLTNNVSKNELIELTNLGIKNILNKNTGRNELFACLDAIGKRRKYYSEDILDLMLEMNEKKGTIDETVQLTSSEIEIVRLIAEGLTTKEIACKKFLSIHTVMTHRKNILRKLGVSNASELIMCAIKAGIIDTIEYHI